MKNSFLNFLQWAQSAKANNFGVILGSMLIVLGGILRMFIPKKWKKEKELETGSALAKEILGKLEQREHSDWFKTDDVKIGHGFCERAIKLADDAKALSDELLNSMFDSLIKNSQLAVGSQAILQFRGSEGKAKAEAYNALGRARKNIEKNYQDIRNQLNKHLMFRW